ncbi:MAG: hypothetical protein M1827_002141 [Pycnora praestabilis]|nr:MAG: hypothetical protein M1827_002141 [Pycnora praestabilis]
MSKRGCSEDADTAHAPKRARHNQQDRLSSLSDELLLRIFSYVPVPTLSLSQRQVLILSRRFNAIAEDSQLWKSAYYNRFVRPRASRIPGIKDQATFSDNLLYSSRVSKWLEDDGLVKRGRETNWKRQYKVRHNWSRGSCDVSEIEVAERPPVPPLLVRLHEGILLTADADAGLRAWTMKGEQKLIANVSLGQAHQISGAPTSLAVDVQETSVQDVKVAIGFEDGRFSIFQLRREACSFICRHTHSPSSNGMIAAIAFSHPYLLTMTERQLLSFYCFPPRKADEKQQSTLYPPQLLSSLKSHTVWPPLSLSLRPSLTSIVASIAYAVPTYLSGWSVGLQEIRLTLKGDIMESRLSSAINQGFQPLTAPLSLPPSPGRSDTSSPRRRSERDFNHSLTKPTSLSYTHPYLLASHPDNTLTLYLVTSTSTTLSISEGSRLWGHTSSVSGAHVGGRGKAVSVSSRGDEMRIWELEGGLSSASSRRRLATGEISVQVRPEKPGNVDEAEVAMETDLGSRAHTGFGSTLWPQTDEVTITRGWIGFDDEKVVVLKEKGHGSQALVVYDFT